MAAVQYRTDFPSADVVTVIGMMRAGEIISQPNKFGYHAHQFVSWGQGAVLPYDPNSNVVPIGRGNPQLAEDDLKSLQKLHDELAAQPEGARAFGAGRDWLSMLLPLVLALLKTFLTK